MNIKITDDFSAEQTLTEFKRYKKEKERLIKISQQAIEYYQNLIAEYNDDINVVENKIKTDLEGYLQNVEMKETKTQYSYTLPSAKIVIKKPSEKIVATDELINVVSKHYVKVKESVDWKSYKEDLEIKDIVDDETGEITGRGVWHKTMEKFIDEVEIEQVDGKMELKL